MPDMNGFQASLEINKLIKKYSLKTQICIHSAFIDPET